MESITKQTSKKAFTIVELLTVMSIIVILIGLLVPALNMVRRYAYEVKEQAQLHSIDTALELFNSEFDGYPDSSATDPMGVAYCGAMKLAEAMMGQDLMGFHPDSIFRSDGMDGSKYLYDANSTSNQSARKGPYLPLENANAFRLGDIYENTGPFAAGHFVLCDVYKRVTHKNTGQKIGMPILYYKANTAKTKHDVSNPDNPENIYNYKDNQELLLLGMPWNPTAVHRLARENSYAPGVRFYMNTRNEKVTTMSRPYRADTFILISAGYDGEYGTPDDVCNFDWKYRELQ